MRRIVLVILLCALPLGTTAQTLKLAKEDDDLAEILRDAAQVLSLSKDATNADRVSAAQGDYERLIGALYDAGYFGPTVSIRLAGREAAGLSVLSPPSDITPIEIRIDQGARFRFGTARVAPLPDGAEITDTFRTGRSAGTGRIRQAARDAIGAWRDASHAKAEIASQSIIARHPDRKLDVILRVDPGPALRFGELDITGKSAVREKRIREITGLPQNAPFSPATLRRMRERLNQTGAFRAVILEEAETPNPDDTLDVTLVVEDAAPRRIGFGAELSSYEGLSLEAFWMHRNAFGGAERLRFDLDVDGIGGDTGGVDYSLGTTLSIPAFRRPDDTLSLFAKAQSLDEPTFSSELIELGVRRERRFDDKRTAAIGASLRASESTTVYGRSTFRHLILEGSGIYDGRDNKLAPHAGLYGEFLIQPLIGLSGSASGLRLTGDLRGYRAVSDKTVLAGRFQIGSVIGPTLSETPPELLFLSGGGGTVRGQPYQSLAIDTTAGRLGGRGFVGLSGELRHELGDNFGVTAFADVGYISEDSALSNGESHAGFGIGARYLTGFGALRLDLGLPTKNPKIDDLQLYIGLGEAF